MGILFALVSTVVWWGAIIFLIVKFFGRHKISGGHSDWKSALYFSTEDGMGQMYLLAGYFFLGLTLYAFNRELGSPLRVESILLLISIVGIVISYWQKTAFMLVFSLLGLVSWWTVEATNWVKDGDLRSSAPIACLGLIALIFYVLSYIHSKFPKKKRFGQIYFIYSIIGITLYLFLMSTKLGISSLEVMTKGNPFYFSWQISLSLLLLLILLGCTSIYALTTQLISPYEFFAVVLLASLFLLTTLLPEQKIYFDNQVYSFIFVNSNAQLTPIGIFWAAIYNILIFFELLGLIFSGYIRKEGWLINLGATLLFLLILSKYFDWMFSFMDKSIFFIGAGILMFVVGFLMEKGRRYMISTIKVNE